MGYSDTVKRGRCNGNCLKWANKTSDATPDDDEWEQQRWVRRRQLRQQSRNQRHNIPSIFDVEIPDHIIARFEGRRDKNTANHIPSLLDIKIPDHIITQFKRRRDESDDTRRDHDDIPRNGHLQRDRRNPSRSNHYPPYENVTHTDAEIEKMRQTLARCEPMIQQALLRQNNGSDDIPPTKNAPTPQDQPTATTRNIDNRTPIDTNAATHQNAEQLSSNPDFKLLVKLLNRLTRLRSCSINWQIMPPKTVAKSLILFRDSIRPPVDDHQFRDEINRLTQEYADNVLTAVHQHIDNHVCETIKHAHSLCQADIDRVWSTVRRQLCRSNNKITASILSETKSTYENMYDCMDCDQPNQDEAQIAPTEATDALHNSAHVDTPTTSNVYELPLPQRKKRKDMDTTTSPIQVAVKIQRTADDEATQNLIDFEDDVKCDESINHTVASIQSTADSYLEELSRLDDLTKQPAPTMSTPEPGSTPPAENYVAAEPTSPAPPTPPTHAVDHVDAVEPRPTQTSTPSLYTQRPLTLYAVECVETVRPTTAPTSPLSGFATIPRPRPTTVENAYAEPPSSMLDTPPRITITTIPTPPVGYVQTAEQTSSQTSRPVETPPSMVDDLRRNDTTAHQLTSHRTTTTPTTALFQPNQVKQINDDEVTSPPAEANTPIDIPPRWCSHSLRRRWKIDEPDQDQDVLVIADSNGTRWIDKPTNWTVYAFSGATIYDAIELIESTDLAKSWKLIIISVGVNDIVSNNLSSAILSERVGKLAATCKAVDIPVLFVVPPRSKTFYSQNEMDKFETLQKCAIDFFSCDYVICNDDIAFAPSNPNDNKHYDRSVARNIVLNIVKFLVRDCKYLK